METWSPRDFNSCTHSPLANGTGYQITYCSCGRVHLTLGRTTLQLDPAEFRTLARGIAAAVGRLPAGGSEARQWLS